LFSNDTEHAEAHGFFSIGVGLYQLFRRNSILTLLLTFIVLLLIPSSEITGQSVEKLPASRQDNYKEILHGVEIVDPYRWLEDQNSSETRNWIQTQNTYSTGLLSQHPSKPAIKARLKEILNIDQIGSLTIREDTYFIWKKGATEELWGLYLKRGIDGPEEILLDPKNLSSDHTQSYTLEDISHDGKLMLYGIRKGGEDELEIHLMDVDKKIDLPDFLPRALYSNFSLKKDKSGFFYGTQHRDNGPRTFYHQIGTDPSDDKYYFGRGISSDKWVSAFVSDDDRYLIIVVYHGWARSDIYIKDIVRDKPFISVVENENATFIPQYAGNHLYLQTNWKAPNGRIVSIEPDNPSMEFWKEIVPQKKDAIQNYSLIGGNLYIHYLHNVTSQIRVYSTDGTDKGEVRLPGPGFHSGSLGKLGR